MNIISVITWCICFVGLWLVLHDLLARQGLVAELIILGVATTFINAVVVAILGAIGKVILIVGVIILVVLFLMPSKKDENNEETES